ncbi:hypothetical protein MKX47_17650 [Solibacillus sp. FSL R7-0668]|uniref:hypothetical protein n=1 Tax=Solibacillus sp. FSL R7-0668 TaxID=2921688 RepID=UPI0030F8D322
MLNDEIILLMQLIKKNGNIDNLVNQGYEYSDVAMMMVKIIEMGYVEFISDDVLLTKNGHEALMNYNKKHKRKNAELFISPQKEYILESKLNVYDVYLPDNYFDLK